MSTIWPTVRSAIPRDPAIEAAVATLVQRMTLAQKVGQMVQAEIEAITPAEVKQFHLGSVLNGGGSWPGKNRAATPADWVALADAYYDASVDTSGPDGAFLPIPILWGTDAVHGHSNVRGATLVPHNIGLGAARDPDLIERIGQLTAAEVACTGLDWTFAPTLAVVRDDRWGRAYESYSEDPAIVRSYAGRMVQGIQGHANTPQLLDHTRVLACAKHFLGDGGTTDGIDQGNTRVDEQGLLDLHAQGYLTALAAGAQTLMASFSSWNGEKMHGQRYLLTEVLRGPLGFDGFVVGDWNGHGQLDGCSNAQAPAAILAGVDMIMVPHDWRAFIVNTIAQVEAGELPVARIDEAVTRILRVKMRQGLLGPYTDRGRPSSRALAGQPTLPGCASHRAVAREAVRKSLVLLKNRAGVLPLQPGGRVLVAGKGAHDVGMQSGGWTLTWQGTETQRSDFPHATTLFEGISEVVQAAGGTAELVGPNTRAIDEHDVIIAIIGETPYAEGQGDVLAPAIHHATRHPEDLALLDRLREHAPGVPVVTVLLTGRPVYCNAELNRSDAFLVAWLPGGEGGGVADVLFGSHPVTGRLPFSWPARPGDTALHPEDADRAGFAYGFGLRFGDADSLGVLPEAPMPRASSEGRIEVFHRGALRPGWSFRPFQGNTPGRAEGGRDRPTVETVDGTLQGSARRVSWRGPGGLTIGPSAGHTVQLSGENAPNTLHFRLRVGRMESNAVTLGALDLTDRLRDCRDGGWHDLALALHDFLHPTQAALSAQSMPALESTGPLTLDIEAVYFT